MKKRRNKTRFGVRLALAVTGALAIMTSAFAEHQTLVIAGGANWMFNFLRYYSLSKLAYETEAGRGRHPQVVASTGKWDFIEQGYARPAYSSHDVEAAIQAAASKLKPGDSFTLFVNDHGGSPKDEKDPLSSKILLYSGGRLIAPPAMSHRKLMNFISKHVPKGVSVKLVGTHCFSGGLHSIAFALPNVCAATSTDFRTPNTSTEEISLYGKGFWEEINKRKFDVNEDSKTSLYEAHMAGAFLDSLNDGRGSLSSLAYVEQILGQGPYKKQDSGWFKTLFGVSKGPRKKQPEFTVCKMNPEAIDLDKIHELAGAIAEAGDRFELEMPAPPDAPAEIQNVYQFLANKWRANKDRSFEKLTSLRAEYAELQTAWENLNSAQKLIQRPRYTEQFEEFERRAKSELSPFMASLQTMQRLEQINDFFQKATVDQKEKFASLLRCEWGSL